MIKHTTQNFIYKCNHNKCLLIIIIIIKSYTYTTKKKKKSYYAKFSHALHKLPTSSTYNANNPNYIISIVAISLFKCIH